MTKEEFKSLIEGYIELSDEIDKVDELLHACIYETKGWNYISKLFDMVLKSNFDEKNVDDLYWWLFEKRGNPELTYSVNGKEIPSEKIDDIWNILCPEKKD